MASLTARTGEVCPKSGVWKVEVRLQPPLPLQRQSNASLRWEGSGLAPDPRSENA